MSTTATAVTKAATDNANLNASSVIAIIDEANIRLTLSIKDIQATVQHWLVMASDLPTDECMSVLAHIMNISAEWHGVNVERIQAYIRHHLIGGRANFSKKRDGFVVTLKSGVKPADFSFKPEGNWWTFELPKSQEQKPEKGFDILLREFVDGMQRKGFTHDDMKPYLTTKALDLLAEK